MGKDSSSSSSSSDAKAVRKSNSRSSSAEYYYTEAEIQAHEIHSIWEDPSVVQVKRVGHSHAVASPVMRKDTSTSHEKLRKSSSSSSTTVKKKSKMGRICCIIGWILALLFLILFIVYLMKFNDSGDDSTTEAPSPIPNPEPGIDGYFPGWPEYNPLPVWEVDVENGFINDLMNEEYFTVQDKIAQMIMPTIASSLHSASGNSGFGPGNIAATKSGSPFGAVHMNIDFMDDIKPEWMIDCDTVDSIPSGKIDGACNRSATVYLCSGCNGTKSEPRAITRLIERFHEASESIFTAKSSSLTDTTYRIPLITAADMSHGMNLLEGGLLYPQQVGVGSANSSVLAASVATNAKNQYASIGFDWLIGPSTIVPRYEFSGLVHQGYSEDPVRAGQMLTAQVNAIQDVENLGINTDATSPLVAVTITDFIGEGGSNSGFSHDSNDYEESQLINIHGSAALQAIEAGVMSLKVANTKWASSINKAPGYNQAIAGSEYLLTNVLRESLGWDGVVLADDDAINGLESGTDVLDALRAGVNMFQTTSDPNVIYDAINDQYALDVANNTSETEDLINESVKNILRMKYRLGLFNKSSPLGVACNRRMTDTSVPANGIYSCATDATDICSIHGTDNYSVCLGTNVPPNCQDACTRSIVDHTAANVDVNQPHKTAAKDIAAASMVLLKNDDNLLPLSSATWNGLIAPVVGIVGSASTSWGPINGGNSLSRSGINDGNVVGKEGSFSMYKHPYEAVSETLQAMQFSVGDEDTNPVITNSCNSANTSLCIIMIGEQPYGDSGGDMTVYSTLDYTQNPFNNQDKELLEALKSNKSVNAMKVVTVYFGGRSLYLNSTINASDSFIVAHQPGVMGGEALAELLTGLKPFAGTLSRSWPVEQCAYNVNAVPANMDHFISAPGELSYADYMDSSTNQYKNTTPFFLGYSASEGSARGLLPVLADTYCRGDPADVDLLDPTFANNSTYATGPLNIKATTSDGTAFSELSNPEFCVARGEDGSIMTVDDCTCYVGVGLSTPSTCSLNVVCDSNGQCTGQTAAFGKDNPIEFVFDKVGCGTSSQEGCYRAKKNFTYDDQCEKPRLTIGFEVPMAQTAPSVSGDWTHGQFAGVRDAYLAVEIFQTTDANAGKIGFGVDLHASEIWMDMRDLLKTEATADMKAPELTKGGNLCVPVACMDPAKMFDWSTFSNIKVAMNDAAAITIGNVNLVDGSDTTCTDSTSKKVAITSCPPIFYGKEAFGKYLGTNADGSALDDCTVVAPP